MSSTDSSSSVPMVTITDQSIITAYNRGPITAVVELPTSCTKTLTVDDTGKFYFGRHSNKFYDPECYPAGSASTSRESDPVVAGTTHYYSPAICPTGWWAAKKFETVTWGEVPESHISLGPETTAALCCPENYTYGGWGRRCASDITQGQTIVYFKPTDRGVNKERGDVSTSTYTKTAKTDARGDGVPIWWQPTDEKVLNAAIYTTATSGTTQIPPSASASITNPASTPTSTPNNPPEQGSNDSASSGGLSTGVKVGIGLSVFFGVAAIIFALVWVYLRRRKGRAQEVEAAPVYEANNHSALSQQQQRVYAYQQPVHEMSHPEVHQTAHELQGSTLGGGGRAAELYDGDVKR